jgi:hypothetical protein
MGTGGIAEFFNAADCGGTSVKMPYTNGQCLADSPSGEQGSVSLTCQLGTTGGFDEDGGNDGDGASGGGNNASPSAQASAGAGGGAGGQDTNNAGSAGANLAAVFSAAATLFYVAGAW